MQERIKLDHQHDEKPVPTWVRLVDVPGAWLEDFADRLDAATQVRHWLDTSFDSQAQHLDQAGTKGVSVVQMGSCLLLAWGLCAAADLLLQFCLRHALCPANC